MQLSLRYYNYCATITLKMVYQLNGQIKKLVSCIIIENELKMGILYGNLYTLYIYM